MKRLTLILLLTAVASLTVMGTAPTTATVDSTTALAQVALGGDGMAAQTAGCTRVTNRFCVIDAQNNCRACR